MSDDELNEHEEWCAFRESVIGGGDAPCDCGVDLTQAHRAGRAEGERAATERIVRHLADVWPDDEEWAFASAIHEIRRATRAQ